MLHALLEPIYLKLERHASLPFMFQGQDLHFTLINRLNRANQQSYYNLHVTNGPVFHGETMRNIYFTIWGSCQTEAAHHFYGDVTYMAPRSKKCQDAFEEVKSAFIETIQNVLSDSIEMEDQRRGVTPKLIVLHEIPRPEYITLVIDKLHQIPAQDSNGLSNRTVELLRLMRDVQYRDTRSTGSQKIR